MVLRHSNAETLTTVSAVSLASDNFGLEVSRNAQLEPQLLRIVAQLLPYATE